MRGVTTRLHRVTGALVCLVVGSSPSVEAQLPDAFAGHFGAVRVRETGIKRSVGGGVMLLTQYGSRWKDPGWPPATPTDYSELETTAAYTYVTAGVARNWLAPGPDGKVLAELSGFVGRTLDGVARGAQDGLHDFRRFPHVPRGDVADAWIGGLELAGSYWIGFGFCGIEVDLWPTLAGSAGVHHSEYSAAFGGGVEFWKVRLQGEMRRGWFFLRDWIEPVEVERILEEDGYQKLDVLLAFDRKDFGNMARVIPSFGVGVQSSTGIFIGERETFLSLFFEFPVRGNDSVHVETVNDMLAGKDRGPTGGLRFTYVVR